MKKKLLISLALALVLSTLLPTAALAAKPQPSTFYAAGSINDITPGKVIAAGATGKWVVVEREITGYLSGSINGAYTMDYHAMIQSVYTQAGDFQGWLTLDDGSRVLRVKGTIDPLVFVGWYLEPGVDPLYPDGITLLYLEINGTWQFTSVTHGNGGFMAGVVFVPTADFHIAFIVPDQSGIAMWGQWQP